MSERTPLVQVNFKPTSTMINGYAADEAELDEALGLIENNAGRIMQAEALLREAAVAAGNIQTAGAAPRPSNAAPAGGGAAPAGGGGGRQCPHGSMLYVEGVSQKTGNPWKAWDCPTKQCQPNRQFVR